VSEIGLDIRVILAYSNGTRSVCDIVRKLLARDVIGIPMVFRTKLSFRQGSPRAAKS